VKGVFPEAVFWLFGIPIRDTVLSTWIMMAIVIGGAAVLNRTLPSLLEELVRFLIEQLSGIMGRPCDPYLPFLGSLAVFIAISNIIGVVPVAVTPTRDINTPLALAIVVFFAVHYFGIKAKGGWQYFKELADPIFVLPLEILGQLSRTVSLTVRLFGNIISTEMIVAVVFMLVPLIAPLPLVVFSMFTGILQAYVFTALAASYIGAGLDSQ